MSSSGSTNNASTVNSESFDQGPCCLDGESGLFTAAHFYSVLERELARLDRWERPLGLVIVDPGPAVDARGWSLFGRLARESCRRIDLAARLDGRLAALVMPDADAARLRRWLGEFMGALGREEELAELNPAFGRALARPREGRTAGELVELALAGLERGDFMAEEPEGRPSACEATAIAADERNLLFAGFKTLDTG